jgi:aerobic-type carbon monoxide dehydrogenase small subunit (CoxS/CutS family)
VNGAVHELVADPETSLLEVLRDRLGLTGSKYGCGESQCGACLVLVDGKPVPACATAVGSIDSSSILTVEGLARDGRLHPVQQAFVDEGALQCGYCTPGMVVGAVALLARTPRPSEAEVVDAMHYHLCRCGVYPRIVRAVLRAADLMAAAGENADVRAGQGGADG